MEHADARAGVRSLTLAGMPLLVVDLAADHTGGALRTVLREAGLRTLPGLIGIDLPRGASVGLLLDGDEVRLVDERETALLRIVRAGLAPDWVAAASRLRGTMLVVTTELGVAALEDAPVLGDRLETEARDGRLDGAIVGVADRRPRLPLLL